PYTQRPARCVEPRIPRGVHPLRRPDADPSAVGARYRVAGGDKGTLSGKSTRAERLHLPRHVREHRVECALRIDARRQARRHRGTRRSVHLNMDERDCPVRFVNEKFALLTGGVRSSTHSQH
ncbi:hypothetical protein PENTCL1PPCAC_20837, partial [Pristionchus entomophagus]